MASRDDGTYLGMRSTPAVPLPPPRKTYTQSRPARLREARLRAKTKDSLQQEQRGGEWPTSETHADSDPTYQMIDNDSCWEDRAFYGNDLSHATEHTDMEVTKVSLQQEAEYVPILKPSQDDQPGIREDVPEENTAEDPDTKVNADSTEDYDTYAFVEMKPVTLRDDQYSSITMLQQAVRRHLKRIDIQLDILETKADTSAIQHGIIINQLERLTKLTKRQEFVSNFHNRLRAKAYTEYCRSRAMTRPQKCHDNARPPRLRLMQQPNLHQGRKRKERKKRPRIMYQNHLLAEPMGLGWAAFMFSLLLLITTLITATSAQSAPGLEVRGDFIYEYKGSFEANQQQVDRKSVV